MANIDAKLKISELDFDTLKTNLKTFLKGQSEFSDYNFEGSGMSILLDLLAYNTHYMGYYLNMVANEMFIDTAVDRNSVVSHAKLLGYVPRSRVASQAVVDIAVAEVAGGTNTAITLPRFTKFASTAAKDGANYTFVNVEQKVASKNATGFFNFTNVVLKEGKPVSFTFIYDQETNPKQIFELPNSGIDISTLQVVVQTSSFNATQETFLRAENAMATGTTSPVYFLQESRNNKYQIYFGDDVIGKKLTDGNIIIVTYLVTSGTIANGLKSFKIAETIKQGSPVTIKTIAESSSGKLEEDVDSIKYTAPKSFVAQNRAVTKNDYIALISRDYPYFDSVTVWGGEEEEQPVYGKIFFSAKPRGDYEISQSEIQYVIDKVIAPMSILTVTPEYVPADYNFLNFKVTVTYDPRKTTKTSGQIQALVYNAIVNYNNANFNTFNSNFKVSRLIRAIDDAEDSIQNNLIEVVMEKRFRPALGQPGNYTLNFNIPLIRGTSINRLIGTPSFYLLDSLDIERECYLEEIPQSFSGVEEIEITDPGNGYTEAPQIVINGDGSGAIADALIVNGKIKAIKMLQSGSGYTTATVTIVGGNGSGAKAKALMEGKIGKIRAYYYDSNSIKTIINNDAGTIYYDKGIVELVNFAPIRVNHPTGTIAIKSTPATTAFATKRNSILTLDTSDPTSTSIDISVEIV